MTKLTLFVKPPRREKVTHAACAGCASVAGPEKSTFLVSGKGKKLLVYAKVFAFAVLKVFGLRDDVLELLKVKRLKRG